MPAGGGPAPFAGPRDEGLPRVSPDTALTHAAYWACVSTVADDLAAMPWNAFEKLPGGGRRPATDHAVDWLLSTQPNPEQTAFALRQAWVAYALTWGNCLLEVERDGAGRPAALWLLEPWRVRPVRDAGGLYFRVTNPSGPDTALAPGDVLHLKGLGDGAWGYSVLEYAARTVGIALVADRHAARGFANDHRPGGVIERKKKMSPEAQDRYRRDWERVHKGEPGATAILEEGDKFTPFEPTSPQDAELLASRKFAAEDVARFFKLPPHKIGLLDRATNNNIEHQSLEYVQGTLQPWAVRMEQAANLSLFGRKQRGTFYTKLSFGSLLRGDSAARSQWYQRNIQSGVMCIDDARELEDLNPLPGGQGKVHFIAVNLQPVDRAINPPDPPAPKPSPASPAADGPAAGDATSPPVGERPGDLTAGPTNNAGLTDALRPSFRDAAARVLRAEAREAAAAAKKLAGVNPPADRPAALARWRDQFLAAHRQYVRRAFEPAAAGLAAGDAARAAALTVLDVEAADRCADFLARFDALSGEPDGAALAAEWEGRADALAARVMTRVSAAARVYGG